MTTSEFSERFDTLIQAYRNVDKFIAQSITEFDMYEKSVFLTKAQNVIVNQLCSVFERNEDARRKLAVLVKTFNTNASNSNIKNLNGNAVFIELPEDLLKITLEKVKINSSEPCYDGKELTVVPITHDDYLLQSSNPFRKPKLYGLTNNVWRLDTSEFTESVELILPENSTLNSYFMRYIKNPQPIILEDIGNLTIDGISTKSECELDSYLLHEEILKLGVQIALSAIQNMIPEK